MGVVLIRRENRMFAVCRDSRIRFEHDPESTLINRSEYQCALQLRRPNMMKRLLRQSGNWHGFGRLHGDYSGPAIWGYFTSNSVKNGQLYVNENCRRVDHRCSL